MPQYLSTTGDRLHDFEIDSLIKRLNALEAAVNALKSSSPVAANNQISTAVVSGVASITPGSGTPIAGAVFFAATGALTLAQSNQTLTFDVPFSTSNPLGLGAAAQGTSAKLSREDHVHPTTGLVTTVNGSSGTITVPASLNGLTGAINIVSGGGCTVTVVGNNVQISVP